MKQTEVMFFFDTEDFTCDVSQTAAMRLANILTEEGVTGHFAVVGLVAKRLMETGRRDVVDALKRHEIGSHTWGHSVHPNICEMSDCEDFDIAYTNIRKKEDEALELIKSAFGQNEILFAVPPGNSKSYAAMYYYADKGLPFYCDTVIADADGTDTHCVNAMHIAYNTSVESVAFSGRIRRTPFEETGMKALPLLYRAAKNAEYRKKYEFDSGCITDAMFVFLDGAPEEESVRALRRDFGGRPLVCLSASWENYIREWCPDARTYTRYMMKPSCRFALDQEIRLPDGFEAEMFDERAFELHPFSHGLNYPSFEEFSRRGTGAVVWHDGKIVASAASFLTFGSTVELDVSTDEAYRGMGLASACVLLMLKDCARRRLEVHWDAQYETSRRLAEKFGFEEEFPYSVYILPERPERKEINPPAFSKSVHDALDELAGRNRVIIYTHPNMAYFSMFWDTVNFCKINLRPDGDYLPCAERTAEETQHYFDTFREIVRAVKADDRFRITTLREIRAGQRPPEPVLVGDVPEIAVSLQKDFAPMWERKLRLYDLFMAAAAFLREEKAYIPGKAYGLLTASREITEPVMLSVSGVRAAAAQIPGDGFLPAEFIVDGHRIGTGDMLYAMYGALTAQGEAIELRPHPDMTFISRYPELVDFALKGTWMHGDDLQDNYLSDRLRLQAWTIR